MSRLDHLIPKTELDKFKKQQRKTYKEKEAINKKLFAEGKKLPLPETLDFHALEIEKEYEALCRAYALLACKCLEVYGVVDEDIITNAQEVANHIDVLALFSRATVKDGLNLPITRDGYAHART
ncbi:hypothetical protein [Methylocella sp.]|jgi:hypothetical protein|uniref:hypothetical protein n=1 Tax=Methylocella sp. TaxID=1978226 RepID=UPI003C292C31